MSVFTVGCDIGGTFTDTVVLDGAGSVQQYKSPTTPADVSEGIFATLRDAAAANGHSLREFMGNVALFSHGTTVATNALLERRGSRTGLIQTRGFGDTLFVMRAGGRAAGRSEEEIRRLSHLVKPTPIVARDLVVEVDERVDLNGKILAPLTEQDAEGAVTHLLGAGVDAIAVCLLWAFRNPEHELLLKRTIERLAPEVFVTVSSDLVPRIKEYERTSTTAVNCYVGPRLAGSLGNLERTLAAEGLAGRPFLMQSNGGLAAVGDSVPRAATTLLSGPAGGVTGSARLGQLLGYPNIVTTDMGGTTFDVGLVVDGEPVMLTENVIGQYAVGLPSIGISAIGAGGGSIAHVRHGFLGVGPESAGASPGPVCYGRGGTEPTVTDANVVLGIIDPDAFLGGTMRLDRAAAEAVIDERIAAPLGLSTLEAAAAVKTITDNKMADLIRRVTIKRGYDPRDFVLFAYGGGGPTHASRYGAEVGVQAIVIPSTAAVHSAYGVATADLRVTFERSEPMLTPPGAERASEHFSLTRLNEGLAALAEHARSALRGQGAAEQDIRLRCTADMRLRGQIHELGVELAGEQLTVADVDALIGRFIDAYEAHFGTGSAFAGAGTELMTLRVEGTAMKPRRAAYASNALARREAPSAASRPVYLPENGEMREIAVHHGPELSPGDLVRGPAIVELPGTTVVVAGDQIGQIDNAMNLVLTKEETR